MKNYGLIALIAFLLSATLALSGCNVPSDGTESKTESEAVNTESETESETANTESENSETESDTADTESETADTESENSETESEETDTESDTAAVCVIGIEYVEGTLQKSHYKVGEMLVKDGAKLLVTYSDGSSRTVDVTDEMVGAMQMQRVGEQNVIITYHEDGVTLFTVMRVTVEAAEDPLAQEKEAAMAEMRQHLTPEELADGNAFEGLLLLHESYVQGAVNEESVRLYVTLFKEKVDQLRQA